MNSQPPNHHDPFGVSTSGASQQPHTATQPVAASGGDSDVIEQVWLDRTQQLLRNFANDPYQLSKEFGMLRAEYIKHRYGKTMATGDNDKEA